MCLCFGISHLIDQPQRNVFLLLICNSSPISVPGPARACVLVRGQQTRSSHKTAHVQTGTVFEFAFLFVHGTGASSSDRPSAGLRLRL